MKEYVVGFLFDEKRENVVLIEKTKPEWQRGLLNGVGGKIEDGERPDQAMEREFQEETGLIIGEWMAFCQIENADWRVYFFYTETTQAYMSEIQSPTEEVVSIFSVSEIDILPVIQNLRWLIPMCADTEHFYAYSIAENNPRTEVPSFDAEKVADDWAHILTLAP